MRAFESIIAALKDPKKKLSDRLDVRLVVGPNTSREAVKDALLAELKILPSWSVVSLSELSDEILKKNKVSVDKPLSVASQADVLEQMARSSVLQKRAPVLSRHLQQRSIATKTARFIRALDNFTARDVEIDAIIEDLAMRHTELSSVLSVIQALWNSGEVFPFSEGGVQRRFADWAESVESAVGLPRVLYFWGFSDLTPLEERVVAALQRLGVQTVWTESDRLTSPAQAAVSKSGFNLYCAAEASESQVKVPSEFWQPHSVFDELGFLFDALKGVAEKQIAWPEVAIFVPNDDLYKRMVRDYLVARNVPIQDPTLVGAWRDQPEWLWWRDLLRLIAGGLRADDMRAWIGRGPQRDALYEALYRDGVHGGAAQWRKIHAKIPLPEILCAIEGTKAFSRVMDVRQFRDRLLEWIEVVRAQLPSRDSKVLQDFADHLVLERPYLDSENGGVFRARLRRYVAFFEEFLESKSRMLSVRHRDGLWFVGHGVWVPKKLRVSIVLGANWIERDARVVDPFDARSQWEGVAVRRAWERVHFGLEWEDRVRRDEKILLAALTHAEEIFVSAPAYGLDGAPKGMTRLVQNLVGEARTPDRTGAHAATGWTQVLNKTARATHEQPLVLRPDLAPQKPISVSSFEDYLKCPFLYLARHVWKLEPPRELALEPNAMARGSLLHAVLESFLREEISLGAMPANPKTRLDELLRERMQAARLEGMFRHPPLYDRAARAMWASLSRWIDFELEQRKKFPTLKPFDVEVKLEYALGGLMLRGKCDRVDASQDAFVVIDYKTGMAPMNGRELREGLGSQLLMYAQALRSKIKKDPAGVYYMTVARAIDAKKGIFLKKYKGDLHDCSPRNSGHFDGDFDSVMDQASARWHVAAEKLLKGDFSPAPARPNTECTRCAYQAICGFERHDSEEGGGA